MIRIPHLATGMGHGHCYRVTLDDDTDHLVLWPADWGYASAYRYSDADDRWHPWGEVSGYDSIEAAADRLADDQTVDHPVRVVSIDEVETEVYDDTVEAERRPIVCSSASTITDEHGVSRVVEIVTDGSDYHLDWATMTKAERDEADEWTRAEHARLTEDLP